MTRHWLTLALLASLAACEDGGDGRECEPGSDPMPGCTLQDCQLGRNSCGGTVYACDNSGHMIELGTCDRSPRDAGSDGGMECTPGFDPIPECSFNACQFGQNNCGGSIFVCDSTGHVVSGGFCDMFPSPVDAAMPFPDADPIPPDAAFDLPDAGVAEMP